jgi:hypothetical protein
LIVGAVIPGVVQEDLGAVNPDISRGHVIGAVHAPVIIVMPDVAGFSGAGCRKSLTGSIIDLGGKSDRAAGSEAIRYVEQHKVNFDLVIVAGNVR